MLSTKVKTTSDLMSIALQAEREAIRRYSELARSMREGNNDFASDLFERMVIEEREHERLLLEWMAQENISENANIGPISWRDPQISTTYNDEARDPYYSTPYRALAFAVHNEEIAFRFYTHVAADSDNKAVRQYAEILAREELGHAALLRAERRRAYHAEREASTAEPRLEPRAIAHKADLLAAAIHIDRRLADDLALLAADTPELVALEQQTRQQLNENEHALEAEIRLHKTSPGDAINLNLQQLDLYIAKLATTGSQVACVQRLCACADRSFAFYDTVVASAKDEAIMLTAQALATAALDRISVLKQVFGTSYLSDSPGD